MAKAGLPENEEERLRALESYDLLDRDVGPVFDDIIRIAADVCDVDISVIALIDHDRQYFLARNNMKPRETPRVIAFCAHAILEPHTTFEIENATKDPRFKDNPLVTGEIGVRFYAAHPLTTQDGYALGGLCLIGKKPKKLNELQRNTIRNLANIVMTLFDARKKEMEESNQRKKIEEALIESEEQFRVLVDHLPSFVNLKDKDGHYVLINQKHIEIFGFQPQNVLGKVISEFLPEEQAVDAAAQERQIIETKTAVTTERKIPIKQENREFLVTKFPIFDASGDIARIGTIGTDITESKRVEEALLKSEKLLDSIFENVPVGLLIKDQDHVVERPNRTYQNWYGLQSEKMLGRRSDQVEDFQSTEDAELMNAQEREVLTTGKRLHRQVERLFADGKIHTVEITKFPVYDQQGKINKVGSVSVDLTKQVQAIQAKSFFLAAMSHDLRTPLNAIIGFADSINLQSFGPIGNKYQEYARDIKSGGEHLLSLVNDILDLSTIETGKQPLIKENIPAADVFAECVRIIEDKAQSLGIDLVTKVPKDLLSLYADRRATKQILLNLLSNSIKFTPKGGKITLRAAATNQHHTIEVSDTGKGIPADKIATLTDPFIRGETDPHKTQEGTGLGLAIVKSLVERHNGELDIKSKVGKGTTVTVTLPNSVS